MLEQKAVACKVQLVNNFMAGNEEAAIFDRKKYNDWIQCSV
jgi:hypothetical protein